MAEHGGHGLLHRPIGIPVVAGQNATALDLRAPGDDIGLHRGAGVIGILYRTSADVQFHRVC